MKPDGSDIKRITEDEYSHFEASWSPDLTRIAASGWPDLAPDQRFEWYEIHILDTLGTILYQLTWNGRHPVWSPDRKQIAFERQGAIGGYAGIYIIDSDGTHERRIEIDPNTIVHICDWSEDGERFLTSVEEYAEGLPRPISQELCEMDFEGNIVRQITDTEDIREYDALWSPDEKSIAFSTVGLYAPIHIVNADGSRSRIITPQGENKIGRFRWSPDGTEVAFSWYGEYGKFEEFREWSNIFVIDTAGIELTQITFDDSTDINNELVDWR